MAKTSKIQRNEQRKAQPAPHAAASRQPIVSPARNGTTVCPWIHGYDSGTTHDSLTSVMRSRFGASP
jgi:hypothetical protein